MNWILELAMDLTDLIYIVFVLICAWLAVNLDSDGGGGKRSRMRATQLP